MKYNQRNEGLEQTGLILASYHRRILSFLIDAIIVIGIYVLSQIVLQSLGFQVKAIKVNNFTQIDFESEKLGSTSKFIIQCILTAIPTIYFTISTFFLRGQTLGKKTLKIRVVSLYHHEVGFWHCLERSLGYVASTLEGGLGFIQAFWNPNRMTLHDKIAETIVIKLVKTKQLTTG